MTNEILASIDSEISVLKQVRGLLAGNSAGSKLGRPARKKRVLSPEARERIAAAQRKRWAKQKRVAK